VLQDVGYEASGWKVSLLLRASLRCSSGSGCSLLGVGELGIWEGLGFRV
jgi:hypothetical protein